KRTLPGFGLTLGVTLTYLTLLVLLPLGALVLRASELTWSGFYHAGTGARALHAYGLSFGASPVGASVNGVFGLCVAWGLARCRLSIPAWKRRRRCSAPAGCALFFA